MIDREMERPFLSAADLKHCMRGSQVRMDEQHHARLKEPYLVGPCMSSLPSSCKICWALLSI